jgi:hypothetical protein
MSSPLGDMPGVRLTADPGQVLFPRPAAARGPRARCRAARYPGMVQVRVTVPAPGTPSLTRPASLSSGSPGSSPRGLIEVRTEDRAGSRIVLVEVPASHPVRRGPRPVSPPRRRNPGDMPPRTGCQRHSYLGDPVRGKVVR